MILAHPACLTMQSDPEATCSCGVPVPPMPRNGLNPTPVRIYPQPGMTSLVRWCYRPE